MKHSISHLILFQAFLFISITSCKSQNAIAPKTGKTTKVKQSSTAYRQGKDYTLFKRTRILDNTGFDSPVEAFSLLIPQNWQCSGEIIWTPPGQSCEGTNRRLQAVSTDNDYKFDMYPFYTWSYSDDQQANQFNLANKSSHLCTVAQPMDAAAYLKNAFGPNELGNPKIINISSNEEGIKSLIEMNERGRAEMMSYGGQVLFHPSAINARVSWGNGSEGIVLLGVNIIETIVPNPYNGTSSRFYITTAAERMVFKYPAVDSNKATNMLSVIMGSIRTNMAWQNSVNSFWRDVRKQKQIAHVGRIRMMDEQTRQMGERAIKQGQQNLQNMDNNMRSWEASQASQDRIHTNFIKTIREVENYRDETGKIELSSGYNHAWSRNDGSSYIMSDNPNFDPASVFQDQRWSEMKKVE